MVLEIKNAEIRLLKRGTFTFVSDQPVRHVKVLPYLSIAQAMEGSYEISLGGSKAEQTGEGGFFIAPAGIEQTIVHHPDPKSGKMRCRWLFIDVEINKAYKLDTIYRFPTVVKDDKKAEWNRLFESLFSTERIWEVHSICYKLLGHLEQMGTPVVKPLNHGMEAVTSYMREHYTENITVKKLASVANMSASNLYAAFKKQCGTSPVSYLNHYRLSIAERLLLETDDTINQISYAVGIKDALYFSKLFKKTYGVSPRDYRRSHRNNTK